MLWFLNMSLSHSASMQNFVQGQFYIFLLFGFGRRVVWYKFIEY